MINHVLSSPETLLYPSPPILSDLLMDYLSEPFISIKCKLRATGRHASELAPKLTWHLSGPKTWHLSGSHQGRGVFDSCEFAVRDRCNARPRAWHLCLPTIKTFVCSVCDKAFGTYASCTKHKSPGSWNPRKSKGTTVKGVTNIVGLNDRNVGGRVPPAAAPPVTDLEINEITDGSDRSDDLYGPEAESSGSISCRILSYPFKSFLSCHILYILSYPSYPVISLISLHENKYRVYDQSVYLSINLF